MLKARLKAFLTPLPSPVVTTCFLFFQTLTEEGCLSVCVDAHGICTTPLSYRTIAELQALVATRTVVVLPLSVASLHEVELPRLSKRKLLAILPYALEDNVVQPLAELHLALGRLNEKTSRYEVIVIDKQTMQAMVDRLDALHLSFDEMTLDWFALKPDEACEKEGKVWLYTEGFKGEIDISERGVYLTMNPSPLSYTFKTSSADRALFEWIAHRLSQQLSINLCQGEFNRSQSQQQQMIRWYYAGALCLLVGVLSLTLMKAIAGYVLDQRIAKLDEAIARSYHVFFPQGAVPSSPRWRVEKWLKAHPTEENSAFWRLQAPLAQAVAADKVTLERLKFQDQRMILQLSCHNFMVLERFKHHLQQSGLQVKQIEAESHDQTVVARLELMR